MMARTETLREHLQEDSLLRCAKSGTNGDLFRPRHAAGSVVRFANINAGYVLVQKGRVVFRALARGQAGDGVNILRLEASRRRLLNLCCSSDKRGPRWQ